MYAAMFSLAAAARLGSGGLSGQWRPFRAAAAAAALLCSGSGSLGVGGWEKEFEWCRWS
ncbi:unnamed protein product, partial [Cuscuta epithymum]